MVIFSVSSASRTARTGGGGTAGVEGGSGDLEQFTRPFDVVACLLLRLDERVHCHRVSVAKKAVARRRLSTGTVIPDRTLPAPGTLRPHLQLDGTDPGHEGPGPISPREWGQIRVLD
ncbi:hypothetical protein ACIRRH_42975 [Kitasatospora sp. NPDC101235]|uniref:hypothetical protein n=1 Tax=Kitasatospora sp. NPDC101235 TaxID=3364101 RepID=UPI003823DCDA